MPGPVERWLETFMCKQYADTFEAYGFKTLQSVCQLQLPQLQAMGVSQEHCEKILENVHVLRQTLLAGNNKGSTLSEVSSFGTPVNSASSALRSVAMNANYQRGNLNHYAEEYGGYGPGGGQMTGMPYPNRYDDGNMTPMEPGMPNYPMGPGYGDQNQAHVMMNQQQQQQQQMANHGGMYPQQPSHPSQSYMGQHFQNQGSQYAGHYNLPNTSMGAMGGNSYYGSMPPQPQGQSKGGHAGMHHHVRQQHPQITSQTPQQVADNILQMASTYPSNQTVQVPISKNRHAPYHIPRSPHYNVPASNSPSQPQPPQPGPMPGQPQAPLQQTAAVGPGMNTTRTMMYPSSSPHSQQSRTSPNSPMLMHSPVSHQSMPSPGSMHSPASGGVKSPVPNLSPSVGGMRSPCSMQPMGSAMSGGNQPMMSPVHMTQAGHGPPMNSPPSRPCSSLRSPPSQPHPQHFSPNPMHSPLSLAGSPYPQQSKAPIHSPPHSQNYHNPSTSSSPYVSESSHDSTQPQVVSCPSNPLQSLQKLVMLPETQVVDPKSVVNDACLPSPQGNDVSKNCDSSAEQPKEDYSCSAGCTESSSPPQDCMTNSPVCTDGKHCNEISDKSPEKPANSSPSESRPQNADQKHDIRDEVELSKTKNKILAKDTVTVNKESPVSRSEAEVKCADISKKPVSPHLSNEDVGLTEKGKFGEIHIDKKNPTTKSPKHCEESKGCSKVSPPKSLQKIDVKNHTKVNEEVMKSVPVRETRSRSGQKKEKTKDVALQDTKLVNGEEDSSPTEHGGDEHSPSKNIMNKVRKEAVSANSADTKNPSPTKQQGDAKDTKTDTQCADMKNCKKKMGIGSKKESDLVVKKESQPEVKKEDNKSVGKKKTTNVVLNEPAENKQSGGTPTQTGNVSKSKVSNLDQSGMMDSVITLSDSDENDAQFRVRKDSKSTYSRKWLSPPASGFDSSLDSNSFDVDSEDLSYQDEKDLEFDSPSKDRSFDKQKEVTVMTQKVDDVQKGKEVVKKKKSPSKASEIHTEPGIDTFKSSRRLNSSVSSSKTSLKAGSQNKAAVTPPGNPSFTPKSSPVTRQKTSVEGFNIAVNKNALTGGEMSGSNKKQTMSSLVEEKRFGPQSNTDNHQNKLEHKESPLSPGGSKKRSKGKSNPAEPLEKKRSHIEESSNLAHRKDGQVEKVPERCGQNKANMKTGSDVDNSVFGQKKGKFNHSHLSVVAEKVLESESKDCVQRQVRKRKNMSPVKFSSRYSEIFADVSQVGESTKLVKKEILSPKPVTFRSHGDVSNVKAVKTEVINIDSDTSDDEPLIKKQLAVCKNEKPKPASSSIQKNAEDRDLKLTDAKEIAHTPESSILVPSETESPGSQSRSLSASKKRGRPVGSKNKTCKVKTGKKKKKKFQKSGGGEPFENMKLKRTIDLLSQNKKRKSDGMSVQGPFIRVKGVKKCPTNVTVINQPQEEIDPKNSKKKKVPSAAPNINVHVSNLPSDKSVLVQCTRLTNVDRWVCALCGKHSSYRNLGDLFGPYYQESHIALLKAADESKNEEKGKKKNAVELLEEASESSSSGRPSRSRRSHSERRNSVMSDSSDSVETRPQEIWVHEDCVLWSDGVCLIGSKVYGLDEAIKIAASTMCSYCRDSGAMVGCLHKGCGQKYHYICAIDKGCFMDEENFCILCPKHKEKKLRAVEFTS